MPILFQYRNIKHLLGMYITKQAEQEIYGIAQKKECNMQENEGVIMIYKKVYI